MSGLSNVILCGLLLLLIWCPLSMLMRTLLLGPYSIRENIQPVLVCFVKTFCLLAAIIGVVSITRGSI